MDGVLFDKQYFGVIFSLVGEATEERKKAAKKGARRRGEKYSNPPVQRAKSWEREGLRFFVAVAVAVSFYLRS